MIVRIQHCRILYGSKLNMGNKTAVSLEFLFWCTAAVAIASAFSKSLLSNNALNQDIEWHLNCRKFKDCVGQNG